MAYTYHLEIDEHSDEGRAIDHVAHREKVTRDEAIRLLLRRGSHPSPVEEMIGALSDPESIAILDDVVADAYRMRSMYQPRDYFTEGEGESRPFNWREP